MSDPRAVPSLDELAAHPKRATELSPEHRSCVVLRCSAIIAAAAGASFGSVIEKSEDSSKISAEPSRLLRVPAVAAKLGFAASYVYELIRRGEPPRSERVDTFAYAPMPSRTL